MRDIDLQIEGLNDRSISGAIRKRVRILTREMRLAGDWRVTIAPSERRGEWDIGIHGPSGWSLHSFSDAVDRLPDEIDRQLRAKLDSALADAAVSSDRQP